MTTDNHTIPNTNTEDVEQIMDIVAEQFARFFWEYWKYIKQQEKINKD